MKLKYRGLLACFLVLVVTFISSGAVFADSGKAKGSQGNYYTNIYRELVKDGGEKWIKPIPRFSDTEFATVVEAYNYVIGMAITGYTDDAVLWHREDYWAKSHQTHQRKQGDCEDWAIYLAALLIYHTAEVTDAWVATGQVFNASGGSPGAPQNYTGGHAWVVVPLFDDMWIVLDPVYPNVAAANPVVVKQYIPDWGREFYVNEAYFEAFRFNESEASGFLEALLFN